MAVGTMLLLIGASWLSGCVQQQVTVQSAWQEKVPRDQSFKRVLIVGVAPNVNQRCAFERFLAAQVKSESVTGIPSCDAMTTKAELTRENVEGAVASSQADAVVATILVAMGMGAKEGGGRDTRGAGYYKATDVGYASGYYGVYGVPVVYGEFQTAPALMEINGEVQVATKVYETRGPTLIYELKTQARDLGTRESALVEVTGAIADRLRRDGLIR